MIFGRGGGGGLINRVTKEASFTPAREVTLQAGSYNNKRATIDANETLSDRTAFQLNAVYEDSESFRKFVKLTRSAVNPTLTFMPAKDTKLTLSYEHLHDVRTADRGITSFQGRPANVPIDTFYGNPADSHVRATADFLSGTIQHQVGELSIRNRTLFGDYDRFYQNYVPGAVNTTRTQAALTAYNNATQRSNLFNQTDLTYVATVGTMRHTLLGGIELGTQRTDNFRNTGYFNNTATSILVPYDRPTVTTPVTFRQSATDANNHLNTDLAAVHAQDQVEFSREWQAIVGLRFDSFDLQHHNNRNGDTLGRKDGLVSPRAGVIYKPVAQASLYANYSVSYLPSSGDQFSSLTTITQQVKPEKVHQPRNRREVGDQPATLRYRRHLPAGSHQHPCDRPRRSHPDHPDRQHPHQRLRDRPERKHHQGLERGRRLCVSGRLYQKRHHGRAGRHTGSPGATP